MRAPLALIAMVTGLTVLAAPPAAHSAEPVAKPVVTAKDMRTGPRICIFSNNGKRVDAPAGDDTTIELPNETPAATDQNDRPQGAARDQDRQVAHDASVTAQPKTEAKRAEAEQTKTAKAGPDCATDTTPANARPLG